MISDFSAQGCAMVWNALAKLGIQPDAEFYRALRHRTIQCIDHPDFNGQCCAMVWNALAKLGFEPDIDFYQTLCDKTIICAQNDAFTGQGYGLVWNALAKLGIEPARDFFEILWKGTSAHLGDMNKQALATTGWSLAVFHALSQGKNTLYAQSFGPVLQNISQKYEEFSPEEFLQVRLAAWAFNIDLSSCLSTHRPPQAGHDISNLFAQHGFRIDPSVQYVDRLSKKMDVGMRLQDIPLRIEVDRKRDFTKRMETDGPVCGGYNGNTALQTFLLQKTCPDGLLVRIPEEVVRAARALDNPAQKHFVQAFMDTAREKRIGTYMAFATNPDKPTSLQWFPF